VGVIGSGRRSQRVIAAGDHAAAAPVGSWAVTAHSATVVDLVGRCDLAAMWAMAGWRPGGVSPLLRSTRPTCCRVLDRSSDHCGPRLCRHDLQYLLRVPRNQVQTQCEIIHGRLAGKLLVPPLPRLTRREDRPEQHVQPAPCDARVADSVRGVSALRSLIACAFRCCEDTAEQCGAVSRTRGALASQFGQSDGRSYSAIARIRVNGPHSLQRNS
jgi:hypothetical protein